MLNSSLGFHYKTTFIENYRSYKLLNTMVNKMLLNWLKISVCG